MSKHLFCALEKIEQNILALGSLVEESTDNAILAVANRRVEPAEEVIRGDDTIDQREVEFEEECLRVPALHQPVAAALRHVVAVFKVNSDLERMGDLASNIAQCARELTAQPPLQMKLDFTSMAALVREMVRASLDALVAQDPKLARKVCEMADEVDRLNHYLQSVLRDLLQQEPAAIDRSGSSCR
jgi:phosphate transport system protein